ncbi:MAG TPA: NGG1p interacting factor NIF3 [Dictyoglomaceae bacterium]|nr:NGG1p interacting factor NIF3 [Dictyoglomaceae bacterium]HOL39318.1 NGG1p interacting factor NIF3 [Dictyoglomaceae bacterium]HOP95029.1 NGG1p interacting factor NIF3 [Dictyoglomaceae bacterium]HPP16000.1 NGG1p interacting factor NIF3 [Dictyoglomaceae bacterium]HPU42979.1 NGG1p interacting factor NIF3 [Dictyoglomaceae bacterium]
MNIGEIYELLVQLGMENDPRGWDKVQEILERTKKEYEKLNNKEDFDLEKLKNPYADTRILYGSPEKEIKRVLVGIDIDTSEILLAKELERNGKKIDLVLSHHPAGPAYASLHEVIHLQEDLLAKIGVPINYAEGVFYPRISEVERRIMSANHYKSVDAAKLLDIPFMCCHTPADNCVATYLQKIFDVENPYDLQEVLDILEEIPEYREATKRNNPPKIFVGNPKNRAGKIFVDMTGGTEGPVDIVSRLADIGIGTIVGMHMSEEHKKEAEKYHVNVVIAGHMASDSLGMNILLDSLEKSGIDLLNCSGFIRISRV